MIDEVKDVLELATNATTFVKTILDLKTTNKKPKEDNAVISSKGYYAQIGSSGNYAQIGSSGYSAKIGSSGYSARIGSSGNYARIGSSGDYAQIGSSGYSAQIGSSGYSARIGSSGNSARIGSSGDSAQIGSSGNYAQIGSSGYSAKIGSSGNYAQIEVTGNKSVTAAIGYKAIAKGCKGTWITLAEYDNSFKVAFVKTEQIDGERLKENVFYTLYNKTFHEVEIIDRMSTIILKRRNNVIKGVNLSDYSACYVFQKDGINAHGLTARQAYIDWLFKTSDRDVSKYQNISKDEIHPLEWWVVAYRTITGACSFGTNNYLEHNKDKYKPEMTLSEVIEATEGQYGSQTFKEFFERS